MRWNEDEVESLKLLLLDGQKVKRIVEILKRSEPSIRKKMRRLGLKSPLGDKEQNGLYFCSKCSKYKTKEEFGVNNNKNNKHHIRTYCLDCEKQYIKDLKNEKLNRLYNPFGIEKTKEEVYGASTKVCSCCKVEKNINEFNWQKRYHKVSSICTKCMKKKAKEYEIKRILKKGY